MTAVIDVIQFPNVKSTLFGGQTLQKVTTVINILKCHCKQYVYDIQVHVHHVMFMTGSTKQSKIRSSRFPFFLWMPFFDAKGKLGCCAVGTGDYFMLFFFPFWKCIFIIHNGGPCCDKLICPKWNPESFGYINMKQTFLLHGEISLLIYFCSHNHKSSYFIFGWQKHSESCKAAYCKWLGCCAQG